MKIGNLDISSIKVGSADCKVYLGDTKLYPTAPPAFQGKWLATYSDSHTSSAECDSSSAISQNEITLTDLVSAVIGDCVASIGDTAFSWCSTLTSITISDSVTSIGIGAFQYCTGLTDINIPDSVTSIDIGAFSYCSSLTSVTIPDSVTSIGNSVFQDCSGLTNVTIGSGVRSFGRNVFLRCGGLTSITIEATTPPTLGTNVFTDTNNCPIYVPAASVNAYKSAWSTYASRIQAIP